MTTQTPKLINFFQKAFQDPGINPEKYLTRYRSHIQAAGQVFQYLELAKPDSKSVLGWKPTKRLMDHFDALKKIVELIGVPGRWAETQNHCQFRATSGAVLNYWKTTGTINFQGSERAAAELRAMLLRRAIVIE